MLEFQKLKKFVEENSDLKGIKRDTEAKFPNLVGNAKEVNKKAMELFKQNKDKYLLE